VKIIIPSRTSPAGGRHRNARPGDFRPRRAPPPVDRPDYHAPAPANQEGALHLHHAQAALEEVQRCTPLWPEQPTPRPR
jgi:hypothetical protein